MAKIVGSVLQGSNDAYAEEAIITQLSTLSRTAWKINMIAIERTGFAPNVNQANIEVAVSRGTKSAMPNVSDRDVIFKIRVGAIFTTSGSMYQNLVDHFVPSEEILIVEENIYLQIDSASTGGTNQAFLSIDVTPKNISEAQRLAILAGRIAS